MSSFLASKLESDNTLKDDNGNKPMRLNIVLAHPYLFAIFFLNEYLDKHKHAFLFP